MRRILWGLIILLAIAGGVAFYIYNELQSLEVEQVTDDLYMIKGLGGNVGVLRTTEGTVIVDTMTTHLQGARIREEAEAVTGQPVVMIINTHYHVDHTHGNPAFDAGTRVVATERTLHHLKKRDASFWEGEAAPLMPNETFSDAQEISIGGKTIQLTRPGRGHTDGDLVAVFVEDKAIHMGDLLFNNHYPNIDLEAGGSVKEWSATLDVAKALAFEHVIPGHGELTDIDGINKYQTFIEQLAAVGADAAANNKTLEDTIAGANLTADAGYEEIALIVPIGLDRDFVITRAWEEATGAVTADD
jgi:glyoxylase-like metal-dependent hydrolase (beta-lactamase superfamily II)